MIWLKRSGAG